MREDTAFSMAVQAMFAYSAGSDKEDLETFEWVNEEEPKNLSTEELGAGNATGEGNLESAKLTSEEKLGATEAVSKEELGAGKVADKSELRAIKTVSKNALETARATGADALKVAKAVDNGELGAGKVADEEKFRVTKTAGEGELEVAKSAGNEKLGITKAIGEGELVAKMVTDEDELDNLGQDENKGLSRQALTNGARLNIDETDKTAARLLFCGTVDNLSEIDSVIKANLTKSWTIERMNKVVLSVVRVASYILLYQKDADVGKTVDKAILTARSYTETHASGNRTAGFVNAILDKVAKSRKKHD